MVVMLVIGFVMVALSIWFTYKELQPFLQAVREETRVTSGAISSITLTFRLIRHLPKLIPSVFDLLCVVFLSTYLGFGGGLMGGVTGLFASNCISFIIFYHTHLKKRPRRGGVSCTYSTST
jgi:hypothetical protein